MRRLTAADDTCVNQKRVFYRSPSAAMHASGAGAGLAVCRRLVEAMGGRMWAAGRPGGGAEVAFSLPAFTDEGDE